MSEEWNWWLTTRQHKFKNHGIELRVHCCNYCFSGPKHIGHSPCNWKRDANVSWHPGMGSQHRQARVRWVITERLTRLQELFQEPLVSTLDDWVCTWLQQSRNTFGELDSTDLWNRDRKTLQWFQGKSRAFGTIKSMLLADFYKGLMVHQFFHNHLLQWAYFKGFRWPRLALPAQPFKKAA